MTNNTEGDRTMTNHDKLYEFEDNDKRLNGICIYDVSIRESLLSTVYTVSYTHLLLNRLYFSL